MDSGWDADYRQRGRLYRGGARLPDLTGDARVLELGCGDGRTLAALAPRADTTVGLDSSRAALSLCPGTTGVELVLGDAGHLPFRDGSFDAVLLLHVLGHGTAGERRAIAAEAVRVAAPGGRVHVRVFSREDLRAGAGREVEPGTRLRETGVLTHYFSEDGLAALFPQCRAARLVTTRWHLRVRGALLPRAEIEAEFEPCRDRATGSGPVDCEMNHNS